MKLLFQRSGIILFFAFLLLIIPENYVAARGKILTVSYVVNKKEKITPSYCTAIWLEKEDGTYVKTLYASDWLAYGGYTLEDVCPTWVSSASWATNEIELPDAISGATPRFGPGEMIFQWKKKDLPPGKYKYLIEVHLAAEFNEIYSGEIELGKAPSMSEAEVSYNPSKHEEVAGLLSDVKVVWE